MKYAGIVCCSNPMPEKLREEIRILENVLSECGIKTQFSECMFQKDIGVYSGKRRADALMELYRDPDISEIFDVFGGDMANQLLPYLDFDLIGKSGKRFWGYSDLTVILNAIYTKTGAPSILYQIRNVLKDETGVQKAKFESFLRGGDDLFRFPYRFVQGDRMEGVVIGGNIRCFLKLVGTPYFPDLRGKILLLEAFGGELPQMITYLSQLEQLGTFRKISGLILGTFTKLEQNGDGAVLEQLVKEYAGPDTPIIRTEFVGHGVDSFGVHIGGKYRFTGSKMGFKV